MWSIKIHYIYIYSYIVQCVPVCSRYAVLSAAVFILLVLETAAWLKVRRHGLSTRSTPTLTCIKSTNISYRLMQGAFHMASFLITAVCSCQWTLYMLIFKLLHHRYGYTYTHSTTVSGYHASSLDSEPSHSSLPLQSWKPCNYFSITEKNSSWKERWFVSEYGSYGKR